MKADKLCSLSALIRFGNGRLETADEFFLPASRSCVGVTNGPQQMVLLSPSLVSLKPTFCFKEASVFSIKTFISVFKLSKSLFQMSYNHRNTTILNDSLLVRVFRDGLSENS